MKNLVKHLKQYKIKPSHPRIKILEYLLENRTHPTVNEIYNHVAREIPTLSKATVYNTIHLFLTARLIRLISIEETEARYDINLTKHGHFRCEKCGRIYDFPFNFNTLKIEQLEELEGFKIKEKDIYLKGICNDCLTSKKNSNKNKI